jgi:hypothetical protein
VGLVIRLLDIGPVELAIVRRYHAEVCGCEGDACELGELLDPARTTQTLEEKLAAFDAESAAVCIDLFFDLSMSPERRADLIALARSRHIEGHGLYGDRELFEWDAERLARERDEELADAIIYSVVLRRLRRESSLDPIPKAEAA